MKRFILSTGLALIVATLLLWHASRRSPPEDTVVQLQPDVQRRSLDPAPEPAKPRDRSPPAFAAAEPAQRTAAPDPPVPSTDDQRVHLQARFAAETVDSAWAGAARQELSEDLGRVASSDVRLRDVECHSSLCRVELNLTSPESGNVFVESWLHQRAWRGPGFAAHVGAEGDVRIVMFLGRPGSDLPYLE